MRFLGTAAADVLPGPLCDCPICREARLSPERGRLRSMFLLDHENLIDCGPDLAAAVMRHGVDITGLKNVFLTHTHEDHFCPSNAGLIEMSRTHRDLPVTLYLSEAAYRSIMKKYELLKDAFPTADAVIALRAGLVLLRPVRVGESFRAGGYEVFAVNTTHKASETETAINYRFVKGGKSLLYACDTGYYTEESLEYLKDSRLDYLILEGTWGSTTDKDPTSHLNGPAFLEQLEIFAGYGIIRDDTEIFCTHVNHKHAWNHAAYQAFFDSHTERNVTVAYDGLVIDRI